MGKVGWHNTLLLRLSGYVELQLLGTLKPNACKSHVERISTHSAIAQENELYPENDSSEYSLWQLSGTYYVFKFMLVKIWIDNLC